MNEKKTDEGDNIEIKISQLQESQNNQVQSVGSEEQQHQCKQTVKYQSEQKPQQVVSTSQQQKALQKAKQQQKPLHDQSESLISEQKKALKAQLQAMEFESHLIAQAIQHTSNLDQAIEFIINKLQSNEKENLNLSQQVKLFFIVRMELKMGTGKIAAQVGHAALKSFQNMRYSSSTNDQRAQLLIQWMENGQKNKILQAQTENDLQYYLNIAGNKYINNCYIRDAGRTQIAAGSMTVAAIGPVRECDADFLSKLKEL